MAIYAQVLSEWLFFIKYLNKVLVVGVCMNVVQQLSQFRILEHKPQTHTVSLMITE